MNGSRKMSCQKPPWASLAAPSCYPTTNFEIPELVPLHLQQSVSDERHIFNVKPPPQYHPCSKSTQESKPWCPILWILILSEISQKLRVDLSYDTQGSSVQMCLTNLSTTPISALTLIYKVNCRDLFILNSRKLSSNICTVSNQQISIEQNEMVHSPQSPTRHSSTWTATIKCIIWFCYEI